MFSIAKLGRGQEDYYLATIAQGVEDYYTGGGEAPGRWIGPGAEALGLAGEVDPQVLRRVLGGAAPSGDPLAAERPGRKDRVPGWDLTFSAPKSVSVLYGLGSAEVSREVSEAHDRAVEQALTYLDASTAYTRRRSRGSIEDIAGEGLIVAAFRHRTSRAGDPQLHTHCLTANLMCGDGRWGALHGALLYRHGRTAGYVYQAVLRSELTARLGVSWTSVNKGQAEVVGVPVEVLRRFSKRRAEIESHLEERHERSAAAAHAATLETRSPKMPAEAGEDLRARWRFEIDDLTFEAPTGRGVGAGRSAREVGWRALRGDLLALDGLTLTHPTFRRRDVVRAVAERLPAGAVPDVAALERFVDDVLGSGQVVGSDVTDRPVGADEAPLSTRAMLAVERSVLDRAAARAAQRSTYLPYGFGHAAVEEHSSRLSPAQRNMVLRLTSSGCKLDVVVGAAGSGKTSALAVAASVWSRAGLIPFGAAISARAAAELEAGAGMPTTTIAQLLLDAERGATGLDRHHVLVIDEAAMVDTRRLDRILKLVEAADAKLVLVGDHHQLPAIGAGGGFRALMERTVPIVLDENHRQQQPWERSVLARLREAATRSEVEALVREYRERGRLHIAGPDEDPRRTMVDDWDDARQDHVDVLMVARRRRDVAFLNAKARRRLQIRREMGRDAMTTAQGRSFAIGDRVLCLKNDRRLKVYNSMFGTVTDVDPALGSMTIAVGAETRTLPRRYLDAGHVDHGYATTVHKAQGVTVDRTFVLADQIMCRESGYTAMSRGRLRNDLYVADSLVDDRIAATPAEAPEHPDLVRALVRSEQEQIGLDTLGL